jgi:hypothetical protein
MTTRIVLCLECNKNPAHSRGLCPSCYSSAQRAQSLSDYPTKSFMDDPESHIRWAFAYFPDLVGDVAVEFGLRVRDQEATSGD